ncbi:hypothetical protein CTKA_00930 [Chthonomonas calidirosea]|uniref:Uncharacterized protein n=1 Tax=Chthonomonas calidirosea (strain DSM 23976 / ICMP 18418 / T49) TaxID=1303518 RepID=S0ESD0_CHTCT|nr:hypothetical protein [Chthonomonas calidirosea]CCW34064.1 hypothetical protein CCALI_00227 [Chthonomonas calidirosea T49]CEK15857.1 hypothetical protein CTKA_00930 [Chthonomonas calidirosea]
MYAKPLFSLPQHVRIVVVLGIMMLLFGGCSLHSPHHRLIATPPRGTAPLPLQMPRALLLQNMLERWKKPLLGRLDSFTAIQRVLNLRPLVEEAADQKAAQPYLKMIAHSHHLSYEQAKKRWVLFQLADILVESGGDENQISSANAAGVAQWIPSLAREQGLKVAPPKAQLLTQQIVSLNLQIAKNAEMSSSVPPSPAQNMLALRDQLVNERAQIDQRFNTRLAVFAQTRYLLHLYPRFPSLAWIFQAYHGGQMGERKLLYLYTGKTAPTNSLILHGDQGHPLTYAQVYLTISPHRHVRAFDYLYSRGDDHRHYWWKVLEAAHLLEYFRKDPGALFPTWNALMPGRLQDAVWYPKGPTYAFDTPSEVEEAVKKHLLLSVQNLTDVRISIPTSSNHRFPLLRPEAYGTLRLINALYKQFGGTEPLTVGDCLLLNPSSPSAKADSNPASSYVAGTNSSENRPHANVGPPLSFSYHATGLVFDLLPPADKKSLHRLEYTLDFLADRRIIAVTPAHDNGLDRWHICPNPLYGQALAEWSAK